MSSARGPRELVEVKLRVYVSARRPLEAAVLAWHPALVAADGQRRRGRTGACDRAGS